MENRKYYKSKRKRKDTKNGYIYTLNKEMVLMLKQSHPLAVNLFISKLTEWLNSYESILDPTQMDEFNKYFLPPIMEIYQKQSDCKIRMLENWFQNGVRLMDGDLYDVLEVINTFYNLFYPL